MLNKLDTAQQTHHKSTSRYHMTPAVQQRENYERIWSSHK
jgi:hypothetical protein